MKYDLAKLMRERLESNKSIFKASAMYPGGSDLTYGEGAVAKDLLEM